MTGQPASQSTNRGADVVLSGNAIGDPPIEYRWLFNGGILAGSTNSTLVLTNVQYSQQGNYSLIVSNALGAIASSNAFLTVEAPPVIYTQPEPVTVGAGRSVAFFASADGSLPLNFQWWFNDNALAGATRSSLVVSNVQSSHEGYYSLAITNPFGFAVSTTASLVVTGTAPRMTAHPQSVIAIRGAPVRFTSGAQGTEPLSYQWIRNGLTLPGETNAILNLSAVQASDAGTYQASVSNVHGTSFWGPQP